MTRPLSLQRLLVACACLAGSIGKAAVRADDNAPGAPQLETYASPEGDTYFALGVSPAIAEPKREPHDLVILFDTSASQTGEFRAKGLAALDGFLHGLDRDDRAALLAVDLNAIALTRQLTSPDGSEMEDALTALRARVPLGSTDMVAALTAAADQLMATARPGRARSVVYIGDGMSTAQLLFSERLRPLMDEFVDDRISVNSYALGPRVDMQLLGSLAKHTGGELLVDSDQLTGPQVGAHLADAARGTVAWPTAVQFPRGVTSAYFRGVPPLRFDRDTIVLGTLDAAIAESGEPLEIKVEATAGSKPVVLDWRVRPGESNLENAYLGKLVRTAEHDGDLGLPTLGAAGLSDLRRYVNAESERLAQLGQQALVTGRLDEADRLVREAERLNPTNAEAEILTAALRKARQSPRGAAPRELALNRAPAGERPLPPPAAGDEPADGQLLDETERQQRVYVQFLQSEVRNAVNDASRMTGYDPEAAVNMLKLTLEKVAQAAELDPEVRAQLRDRVETALQIANRQAIIQTERELQQEQIAAEGRARERINRELFLQEQKIDQLMARFNALMDEERYRDAEAVADVAEVMSPNTPGLRTAELTARMVGYTSDMWALRDARHKGVIDSMYQIELSHIPTPDEPPILYPDPEVWQLLTERRKKYKAVDLTQNNPTEAKIVAALDDKTEIEFVDQPLTDVVEYLKERHGIEIQLDTRALTDAGLGSDTPVSRNLKGITLRSALRLMLSEMDLTYVIRDEVLMITSKTEAENMLSTRVYPVGDLVVPIQSGGMGGMGGMGRGMF